MPRACPDTPSLLKQIFKTSIRFLFVPDLTNIVKRTIYLRHCCDVPALPSELTPCRKAEIKNTVIDHFVVRLLSEVIETALTRPASSSHWISPWSCSTATDTTLSTDGGNVPELKGNSRKTDQETATNPE